MTEGEQVLLLELGQNQPMLQGSQLFQGHLIKSHHPNLLNPKMKLFKVQVEYPQEVPQVFLQRETVEQVLVYVAVQQLEEMQILLPLVFIGPISSQPEPLILMEIVIFLVAVEEWAVQLQLQVEEEELIQELSIQELEQVVQQVRKWQVKLLQVWCFQYPKNHHHYYHLHHHQRMFTSFAIQQELVQVLAQLLAHPLPQTKHFSLVKLVRQPIVQVSLLQGNHHHLNLSHLHQRMPFSMGQPQEQGAMVSILGPEATLLVVEAVKQVQIMNN